MVLRWVLVAIVAWLASSPVSAQYPLLNGSLSTLDIETCNGFVNQRLSILYGLVIAKKTRRAVYLPMLRLNGRQFVDESSAASNVVPFSKFYDADHFIKTISPHVPVLEERVGQPHLTLHVQPHDFHLLWTQANFFREPTHIACPLFKLPPDMMLQHAPLVKAWLDAFKPAPRFEGYLNAAINKLHAGKFNFLHWRAEQDCTCVAMLRCCNVDVPCVTRVAALRGVEARPSRQQLRHQHGRGGYVFVGKDGRDVDAVVRCNRLGQRGQAPLDRCAAVARSQQVQGALEGYLVLLVSSSGSCSSRTSTDCDAAALVWRQDHSKVGA